MGKSSGKKSDKSGKKNNPYLRLKKSEPAFIKALDELGSAARKAGPLDEKTVQLIQLAAAAAIGSEGSVRSHVRRALEDGAKAEEIRQALMVLATVVGLPNVLVAIGWADEVIAAK